LSAEAIKVLERYEKELGAKNVVLEKALLSMDRTQFKAKLDTHGIESTIKRVHTGVQGLDESLGGDLERFCRDRDRTPWHG
jgi:circadian clock protein KaiC